MVGVERFELTESLSQASDLEHKTQGPVMSDAQIDARAVIGVNQHEEDTFANFAAVFFSLDQAQQWAALRLMARKIDEEDRAVLWEVMASLALASGVSLVKHVK